MCWILVTLLRCFCFLKLCDRHAVQGIASFASGHDWLAPCASVRIRAACLKCGPLERDGLPTRNSSAICKVNRFGSAHLSRQSEAVTLVIVLSQRSCIVSFVIVRSWRSTLFQAAKVVCMPHCMHALTYIAFVNMMRRVIRQTVPG